MRLMTFYINGSALNISSVEFLRDPKNKVRWSTKRITWLNILLLLNVLIVTGLFTGAFAPEYLFFTLAGLLASVLGLQIWDKISKDAPPNNEP